MIKRLFLIAILSVLIFGCRKDFFDSDLHTIMFFETPALKSISRIVRLENYNDSLIIFGVGYYSGDRFVMKKKGMSFYGNLKMTNYVNPGWYNSTFQITGYLSTKRKSLRMVGHYTIVNGAPHKGNFEIVPYK